MIDNATSRTPPQGQLGPALSRRSAIAGALALAGSAHAGRLLAQSTASTSSTAIARLIQLVRTNYQDAAVGASTADALAKKLAAGDYSRITDPSQLADRLTGDLVALTADKHMRVSAESGAAAPTDPAHDQGFLRSVNYGLMGVRQSQAEVAIASINFFPELTTAPSLPSMYGGLMALVAPSRGLIIDLTDNIGGAPETVAYLMSYFFNPAPRKIAEVAYRHKASELYRTSASIAGPRYGAARPVAIVVSSSTFSAGEAFAYHMRAQGRATIVGEPTRGGANPGDTFALGAGFDAFIPTGRVADAVTGKNWQGTGIKPDISASGAAALQAARKQVLSAALEMTHDPAQRAEIEFGLAHA